MSAIDPRAILRCHARALGERRPDVRELEERVLRNAAPVLAEENIMLRELLMHCTCGVNPLEDVSAILRPVPVDVPGMEN